MAGRLQLSRLQSYGLASTAIFCYTILHAFRQRSNFYSAAVYLSKSNACMMILWNQGIYQTVLFGKLLQTILFGELRIIEVERLQERGWFAITETLLALTIFKDEFDSSFVLLFVSLLFLKVFHWLAGDRVELMEQSANIPRLFHLRMGALLSMLWFVDALLLVFAIESILIEGPTVMIMFASEYMILLALVWSTTMKYALNVVDLRSEVPWEEKSIYVFYVDLATDFFKLVTYVTFFGLILTFYGLPLNILRDVYLTFRSFILKCRDLRRYRQATRNMDSLYPDASAEEMDHMVDKTCIICREDMEYRGPPPVAAPAAAAEGEYAPPPPPAPAVPRSGPNDTPKKLPCGHVFHFHCLRSWLERQQSCPTCRRPVLASDQARAQTAAAAVAAARALPAADDVVRQAQINLARNLGREAFAVVFPGIPFPAEAGGPAPAVAPAGGAPVREPAGGVDGGAPAPNGAAAAGGPTPTPTASTSRAGAGSGHDNPLARFSLPDLRLPPSGEAGLYGPGPSTALGTTGNYGGVAYGGYPTSASRAGQPLSQAQSARVPNLEERLAHIRARMAQATAAQAGTTVPAPATLGLPPSLTPTPTVPFPSTSSPPSTSGPPSTSSAPLSTSVPTTPAGPAVEMTPEQRQAQMTKIVLEAVERRALANRTRPGLKTGTSSSSPLATSSSDLAALPGDASASATTPTPTFPPGLGLPFPIAPNGAASTSSSSQPTATPLPPTLHPRPLSSPQHLPSNANAYPRLIPLFNPDNPAATTLYPNLLSSMPRALNPPFTLFGAPRPLLTQPLLPASPTEEQLRELSQLTRAGIEERMRVLVGFQDRMAALAADMGKVLGVLPDDSVGKGKGKAQEEEATEVSKEEEGKVEPEEGKVDKGKRPVEGIHAVVDGPIPVEGD